MKNKKLKHQLAFVFAAISGLLVYIAFKDEIQNSVNIWLPIATFIFVYIIENLFMKVASVYVEKQNELVVKGGKRATKKVLENKFMNRNFPEKVLEIKTLQNEIKTLKKDITKMNKRRNIPKEPTQKEDHFGIIAAEQKRLGNRVKFLKERQIDFIEVKKNNKG